MNLKAIGVLVVLASTAAAQEQPANFSIFPVTTPLQRLLLDEPSGQKDYRAVALIDGTSFIDRDGKIDSAALDLQALQNGLKPYRSPDKGAVSLILYVGMGSKDNRAEHLMQYGLESLGKRAGFREATVFSTHFGGGYAWQKKIDEVNRKTGAWADADEPIFTKDTVRLAGVRTILSRYLTSNADCYVQVSEPIADSTEDFPPTKHHKAIQELVSKASFHERETMLLSFKYKKNGKAAIDRFVESRDAQRRYAESFGFKDCRIKMAYQLD